MTSWKIGSILNGLLGGIFILFLITITSPGMPDSSFVRMINDFIVRTNIFAFNTRHWWRFVLFLVLMFSYLSLTTFMPLIILGGSIKDLHPEKSIKINAFGVYTIFGLFTPFGIFFLLGMFFIREDLRRIRELKFRHTIEDFEVESEDDFYYDEEVEDNQMRAFYNEKYSGVGKDNPWKDQPRREVSTPVQREVQESFREYSSIVKKVDKMERRLDDVEDDLYHQKRKTRKANKVLDDIQDALENR